MSMTSKVNKESLTWELLENEIRESFTDEDSEFISQMMDDLKLKYKLPDEEKIIEPCKKSGHYGC